MRKKSKLIGSRNLNKKLLASALLMVYAMTFEPALCQVIPDGRTATTVTPVTANVTNVTTTTVRGINAFNSFSKFNIASGNTVNLHLGGATNLINLINDSSVSNIDGVLNSIKDGKIGGNIYLLNPHGVLIGETGRVNVGSLNIFTPPQSEMDKIISSTGEIGDAAVTNLLNNGIPVTESGVITVRGKVNAAKDISLHAGSVNISGDVLSAAVFQGTNVNFSDIVNTNEYDNQNLDLISENGKIVVKAVNDIEISGKIVTDGGNNLNAGNIEITSGRNITATTGAVISANKKGINSQGGAITLTAQNSKIFNNEEASQVSTGVSLSGTTIEGNSIAIKASSETTNTAGIALDEVTANKNLANAGILNYTGLAGYLNGDSKAEVIIGSGTQIISDSIISLESNSKSDVRLKSYLPGVTYGESTTTSLTKIANGASLSAQGDIEVKSISDNKLKVDVVPPLGGNNISVAMSEANSDTQAYIESGATISANNVKVGSFNVTNVGTEADPVTTLVGLSGVAVALSNAYTNTKAYVGSDLNIAGNLDIVADSASKNVTESGTSGADHHNPIYNGISQDINSLLLRKLTGTEDRDNALTSIIDNMPGSIVLSSALSYSRTANNVNSYIGEDTTIKADNINISSFDLDVFQVAASSKAGTNSNSGGVFTFGDRINNANAYIGNTASVDSKHDLNITSEVVLPYRSDFDLSSLDLSLGWPDLSLSWPNIKLSIPDLDFLMPDIDLDVDVDLNLDLDLDLNLPDIATALGFDADVSEGYLSSYANSKKSDATVSGSVNISTINNQASSYIGNNARINTDRAFAGIDQNINISSKTKMDKINYTGIGLKGADTSGAGGSYGAFDYNNRVSAYIDDNSSVYSTGDVVLNADSEEKIINLARAGSSTGQYAVVGVISDNHINSTIQSYVKGSSNVYSGGDLDIDAADNLWTLNIAGGVAKKANVGAGISISNNNITQDISSFIGKKSTEASSGIKGNIQANNVNLSASADNGIYSLSLAGATGSAPQTGKFGAHISGDASFNSINSKLWSYINDDVDVTATNDIILNSDNSSGILTVSGGASTGGVNAGIAGSYSDNNITFNTGVSVDNAKLSSGRDINLTSNTAGKIKSASIGAATASSVGVAGSVAFNTITSNSDSALLNTVTVINASNLDIDSSSDLKIYSLAGGVGVASGVGAGAAYVNNSINNTTRAKIGNSIINAGNVNISSLSRETIKSLSAAAGVAKTAGIAGSIALNNINSTTESLIDDNATVTSTGNVIVIADNDNTDHDIKSYAGTLAGGLSVGVGGTIATNQVTKTTKAHIDNNATVNAGGSVEVKANSGGDILVKTGNVGIGLIGATATISANVIKNTTDAYVENATISAGTDGNIKIEAKENSKIDSLKIAAAAGKVGVGASGDINVINNLVTAQTGGTLTAGKDINVIADSTEEIDSYSYAFSGGLAALAGSISASSIGSGIGDVDSNSIPTKIVTEMANGVGTLSSLAGLNADLTGTGRTGQVLASVANNARLTSNAGNITIKANNISDLDINAGGYSLGVVAAGGSIAVGSTSNRIKSIIGNNASLIADSGNLTIHAISDDTSFVNSYGGSNGIAAIAGSVAQLGSDKITSISTGTGTAITGNNVELKAYSNNDYDITAEGDSGGIISVAGSYAISNLKNYTSVTMNSGITAGTATNILSLADNNINQIAESTAGKSRSISDLVSDLFSGDLLSLLDPDNWFNSVLSIGGGVSSISFDNDSIINIGNSASVISADTDLDVGNSGNSSIVMQAIVNNYINSETTTNCTAEAVALAASVSRVDHWTDSSVTVSDNAIVAGKTIDITAKNNIDGSSEAISNVNPDTNIDSLINEIASRLINNFLWGKLNGVMSVTGLKTSFENSIRNLNAADIAWDIFWHGDFSSITNLVSNIKNSAESSLTTFSNYKITSLPGDATNYFTSTIMDSLELADAFKDLLPSLYGDSNSVSRFDLKQANANIYINSGAQLLSKNSLNITANNNEITDGIYSGAESTISNNLFGNTNAKSYTTVNSSANVNIADDTLIESSNILISSDSDINKTGHVYTNSRGTAFDIASGNLTKSFALNFFNSAVSSIMGSPVISWTEDVPILNYIGVVIGWVTETVTETVNIASECGSRLNSVTKYAGINDTFNLIRYQNTENSYITSNQNSSAVLNGDINILGASERILTVNADGTIDPVSNFIPTISDVILVKNSLESSKLGIYVPNGTVSGNAILKNVLFYAPTTINNYSNKDLVIQDLNVPASGSADIHITARINNFNYEIDADSETKFGDSSLNVYNPESNLTFLGEVGSPITNIIASAKGNITGTGSTLVAKNLNLLSTNGNINGINVYLTNLADVSAQSNGLVDIGILGLNYLPIEFGNYYGNQILNINNLSASSAINFNANGNLARHYSVSSGQGLLINSQSASSGALNLNSLTAGTDININSSYNDLNIKAINSTTGNVSVSALNGSITDANNNDSANILGQDITLSSTNGSIGSVSNYFDMQSSGILNADATNNIYLRETSGNMNAELINSDSGNIGLIAHTSILNARNDNLNNIIGKDITLRSLNGSLGTTSKYLNIKSAGIMNMQANSGIYFANNEGDLNIGEIITNNGSIGIHVPNGNATITHISAPEKINITVDGNTLNIGTIDPTELSLKVSSENGQITVNDGLVSDRVTLIADNIDANFTDTSLTNPLKFTVTGNDGAMANLVDLNIQTSTLNSDIFNANRSTIISGTDKLNMSWVSVGQTMDINSPGRNILVYNNNNYLSDADVQLYSLSPFRLSAQPGTLVQTNAYITNYDKNQIVNQIDTENSIVKSAYKNTTKIQYVVEDELSPLDMSTMAKNQRNNIRWDINRPGIIKLQNNEASDIRVTNISSGGAGIVSEKDITSGEEVQLTLKYNGLEINAKAKIVRKTFNKETSKYDYGLIFTEIDDSVAELIPYACMSVNAL